MMRACTRMVYPSAIATVTLCNKLFPKSTTNYLLFPSSLTCKWTVVWLVQIGLDWAALLQTSHWLGSSLWARCRAAPLAIAQRPRLKERQLPGKALFVEDHGRTRARQMASIHIRPPNVAFSKASVSLRG